jgi:DNA-binding IclR family transcriptional regulator
VSTNKPTAEQAVLDALGSRPQASVDEIAAAVSIGRSTVGKVLAALERAARVQRTAGGREGGRRLPDRWSLATDEAPGEANASVGRLAPGQLDGIVLGYLRQHSGDGPLAPTAVAKALGRSSGAVGNCLARLVVGGRVVQVSERPRRYQLA